MAPIPKIPSPYSRVGAKLVDQGWRAIPCRPGSKRPGAYSNGGWYGNLGWNEYCDRMPTTDEVDLWDVWPNAGVCVVLDHQVKVVDIDTDDEEQIAAIMAIIGDSPVKKRGQKGFSLFFRGSEAIISRAFNVSVFGRQQRVVDLLAYGKQTVCPPTIHPDTMEPYQWLGDPLEEYTPDQLPVLADDVADRIAACLESFGYVAPVTHEFQSVEPGDSMWRDINSLALKNLDMWVPALKLPKCKRTGDGRYRAVAEWRGGDGYNVSFHENGIRDMAQDKGMTPIDVVMAVFSSGLDAATDWLKEKLGYEETQKRDVTTLLANWRAKKEAAAAASAATSAQPPAQEEAAAVPVTAHAPAPKRNAIHYNPFTPEEAGGVIGAISQWAYDTARRPVPEFSVMMAVAFMTVLFGRRAVGPTGAGLNMYLVGIAGPGFGKEHPLKAVQTLAVDAKMPFLIGPSEVTSGSAIEKVLRKRPVFLMPWDEMGVVLQSVTGRGASSWAQTIRKVLLEVFSKSTSMWSGKEHADPMKDSSAEPIYLPTLSVMGVSTPTTFYKGITEDSLSDGFVARLVVIEPTQRPDRHKAPPVLITPASLVAAVHKCRDDFPEVGGNLPLWRDPLKRPAMYTVPWASPEAEKKWTDIEDWQIAEIEDHGASDGIVGRVAEQTIKLATIRAISRNPAAPEVDESDVDWGHAIVQHSITSINRGVEEYMAGSQFEELTKAIMAALRKTKDGSIAQSVLVRARGVSKADDRMVEQAIKRLVLSGEIKPPKIEGKGVKIRMADPVDA